MLGKKDKKFNYNIIYYNDSKLKYYNKLSIYKNFVKLWI